jgi:FkbM family methyltransferase
MKKILKSFPFLWAIKFVILKAYRKITRMEMQFAFSQTGEDLLLRKLLGLRKGVFYVDVGSNHPVRYSNTLNMYLDGGMGICIDANKDLVDKFRKIRKRDIVVRAAISDIEEEVTFHISSDDLVSTADTETYEKWSKKWNFEKEEVIKTRTLNSVLDEKLADNQIIDVLSIDVEGYDFKVLRSVDLDVYRPKIIVIEIHDLDLLSSDSTQNDIIKYMSENGYILKHYANINAYFIDPTQELTHS